MASMRQHEREDLMMCIGKLRGIVSMLEFDEEDAGSDIIAGKILDVLQDMEMIVKGIERIPVSRKEVMV